MMLKRPETPNELEKITDDASNCILETYFVKQNQFLSLSVSLFFLGFFLFFLTLPSFYYSKFNSKTYKD